MLLATAGGSLTHAVADILVYRRFIVESVWAVA
jgi:hypothetical protein